MFNQDLTPPEFRYSKTARSGKNLPGWCVSRLLTASRISMLCEQRPRVTGSVALHAAPGSRFAPFGFHDFMPHTQCDVQEQLDSVDKKLVAAMVVMIVAIMCLLIYFFPKPALGPHFSPCIENSQVQKNLGFHLRIFYQAKCIRCICSASSELFVPRRMPGLTSEV